MKTEMIDRLYLELSQVTKAVTDKEASHHREVVRLQGVLGSLRADTLAFLENDDIDQVDTLREILRDAVRNAF